MLGEFDGGAWILRPLGDRAFRARLRKLTPLLEMRSQSLTRSQFFLSKFQPVK
jgi:hypothetical protein